MSARFINDVMLIQHVAIKGFDLTGIGNKYIKSLRPAQYGSSCSTLSSSEDDNTFSVFHRVRLITII